MSKLEVQLAREAYAPGDTIEGVIVATERIKARDTEAELCYVDESPDYVEQVVHGSTGSLRRGALEPGTETPFVLQLPAGALPNWDPAGMAPRLRPEPAVGIQAASAVYGGLYWAIAVLVDRRWRRDLVERHPVPLRDDRSLWTGTQPTEAEREVKRTVKGWDVDLGLDRWWLHRGEELAVSLTIGNPAADRGGLGVGMVCEAKYDVETTTVDHRGQTTTQRETKTTTAHEEWAPIDPSAPMQQLHLRVPEDVPFSYERESPLRSGPPGAGQRKRPRSALGFAWKVVAREEKRLRRDPRREAAIQVLP